MKIGKHISITPTWGDIVISKHKSFEYQIEFGKWCDQPLECSLSWTKNRDHAGAHFTISIYKLFWLNLNIHDHRHWDYENDTWKSNF